MRQSLVVFVDRLILERFPREGVSVNELLACPDRSAAFARGVRIRVPADIDNSDVLLRLQQLHAALAI